jgi:2-dehydro-3-deoxyphosphooctonate aldolase (KDO 8-P synthase)
MTATVQIGKISVGAGHPLAIVAGPCVIEDEQTTLKIARHLSRLCRDLAMPLVFKASYDKANRTSLESFRGPGLAGGLAVLSRVREEIGIPVLSDVHRIGEIERAAAVLDVIQIPAFLCRQTDFILEAARTGKPINIKKGQFLSPWEVANVIEKVTSTGNRQVLITERGTLFGYNNLVVDFRSLPIIRESGWPVVFDATHSVQTPGGSGNRSGGDRRFAPVLARAAVAAGADAVFTEVHFDPDRALCDGPNSLRIDSLPGLYRELKAIRSALAQPEG